MTAVSECEPTEVELLPAGRPHTGFQTATPERDRLERQILELKIRRLRRQRNLAWLLIAVAAIFAGGLAYERWVVPGSSSAEEQPVAVEAAMGAPAAQSVLGASAAAESAPVEATDGASDSPVAASASGGDAASGAAEAVDADDPEVSPTLESQLEYRDVLRAIEIWADAWSARDVEAYLASYAWDFRTPDGLDRAAWEALRSERLTTPEWIRVETKEVRVERLEDDRVEATFLQTYAAPDYADRVRKALEMVERGGSWRITAEQTLEAGR